MKNIITVLLFISSMVSHSQDLNAFFTKADAFFQSNVSNGKVAYSNIHKDPNALNELLTIASTISVSESDASNYQAFWINAYNLAVIKGIIDHYPTKSPLDHNGFFDGVTYKLAGKDITLNDIENKQLRAKFKDARIHFVLVCGAIGCPPLISKAYLPGTLEQQLNKQTKLAINGSFIKVNTKKKRIQGSEILKWYKEDFTMNGTTEIDFINKYRNEKISGNYKLSYFPYDWRLNRQ